MGSCAENAAGSCPCPHQASPRAGPQSESGGDWGAGGVLAAARARAGRRPIAAAVLRRRRAGPRALLTLPPSPHATHAPRALAWAQAGPRSRHSRCPHASTTPRKLTAPSLLFPSLTQSASTPTPTASPSSSPSSKARTPPTSSRPAWPSWPPSPRAAAAVAAVAVGGGGGGGRRRGRGRGEEGGGGGGGGRRHGLLAVRLMR